MQLAIIYSCLNDWQYLNNDYGKYTKNTCQLEMSIRKTRSKQVRTIEDELKPLNFSLATAWRKATM